MDAKPYRSKGFPLIATLLLLLLLLLLSTQSRFVSGPSAVIVVLKL